MKVIKYNLNLCLPDRLYNIIDECVMEKEIGLLGNECRFIVKLINAFLLEVIIYIRAGRPVAYMNRFIGTGFCLENQFKVELKNINKRYKI
jgi:hypothetical protein